MQKKKIWGNLYFFTKKSWFSRVFSGTASVWSRSLYQPLVPGLFFLFSSSLFYAFCFSPTSGILRKLIYYGPSYFGITRRNIKKFIFLYLIFFYESWFSAVFSAIYGQRSVAETWSNPSPWSIFVFILFGDFPYKADKFWLDQMSLMYKLAVSLFFSLPILLFTHSLSTGVYRSESGIILRRIRPAEVYNLLEFLLMDLPWQPSLILPNFCPGGLRAPPVVV